MEPRSPASAERICRPANSLPSEPPGKLFIVESRCWVYEVDPSQLFQLFCMFKNAHDKTLEIKKSSNVVLIAYRARKRRVYPGVILHLKTAQSFAASWPQQFF